MIKTLASPLLCVKLRDLLFNSAEFQKNNRSEKMNQNFDEAAQFYTFLLLVLVVWGCCFLFFLFFLSLIFLLSSIHCIFYASLPQKSFKNHNFTPL